jgi:hypothetical protein
VIHFLFCSFFGLVSFDFSVVFSAPPPVEGGAKGGMKQGMVKVEAGAGW